MKAKPGRISILGPLLLVSAFGALLLAGATSGPRPPGPKERCPACGMLVAPHEAWIAQAHLADGSIAWFDGSKCLFRFLLTRPKGEGQGSPAVAAGWVTGYYDLKPIPFEKAWFVIGSDVTGPMGAELVPFPTRKEAEGFSADHKGRSIVRSSEVTLELLSSLQ